MNRLRRPETKQEYNQVDIDSSNVANWLMLLAHGHSSSSTTTITTREDEDHMPHSTSAGRVFECKTCNRRFPSFQALGGHRASHKKPRSPIDEAHHEHGVQAKQPRTHECAICGLEFAIGQALGGHMRRHRNMMMEGSSPEAPVVKRLKSSSASKAGFRFDLNLTPMENDLRSSFGLFRKVDVVH